MRFILTLMMTTVLGIGLSCQTASSSTLATKSEKKTAAEHRDGNDSSEAEHSDDDDEVKRISLEDAKKAFDAGDAIFVDSRSKNAYENEHIKGAINIPAADFDSRYKELPKDKKIIVYCS